MELFISYARRDGTELARRLCRDLKRDGHRPWLDTTRIEGGASWSREIEKAIDRCATALVLMSQGSFQSEICRAEQLRALRRGKRVIPLLVQPDSDRPLHLEHLHYLDFSEPAGGYKQGYSHLANQLEIGTFEELPEKYRKTPVALPPLPLAFVERPGQLEKLRRAVLSEGEEGPVAITALRGMGGVGKTVLSQALCEDEAIQDAFPDGIIWVDVGLEPGDLVGQMRNVAHALGDSLDAYVTRESSMDALRGLLQDKAVLLVLDNVWDAAHVRPFWTRAPRCRILFSTRYSAVAVALSAPEIKLHTFSRSQSLEFLRGATGREDPMLDRIADRLGDHPLALKLAAARLKEGLAGEEWLRTFRRVSQLRLGLRAGSPEDNLKVSFDLSLNWLKTADGDFRPLFHALGVFPKSGWTPRAVVRRLWRRLNPELSGPRFGEVLNEMSRLELVEIREADAVRLHDLLFEYARENLDHRVAAVQQDLLDSYNYENVPWHRIEDDGYLYRNLAFHLLDAGRKEDLRRLLLDFDWLQAKLEATDINAVLADYDALHDEKGSTDSELRTVKGALLLSAHVLAMDRTQVAGQLWGRLSGGELPAIRQMLERAKRRRSEAPWLRPLIPTLRTPGGPLLRTLVGHTMGLTSVAILEKQRIVSGSLDQTLRLWDSETGECERTLEGHKSSVTSVAVVNSRVVVSGSGNGTLRVWDLDTGKNFRTFRKHTEEVTSIAVLPDGRVISASLDQTLRIWDLESGKSLRLVGHTAAVSGVGVSNSGHVISASEDGTVRVWDTDTGESVRILDVQAEGARVVALLEDGSIVSTLTESRNGIGVLSIWNTETDTSTQTSEEYTAWITSVAYLKDGQILCGTDEGPLLLWAVTESASIQTFEGHTGSVSSVAVLEDGRVVSASYDKTLKLWDLTSVDKHQATSQDITDLKWHYGVYLKFQEKRHAGAVTRLVVLSDTLLISASEDETLRVWNVETGKTVRVLQGGHIAGITDVAVLKNGRVISASHDGTMRLWDLEQRKSLKTRRISSITGVLVLEDGRVLSASYDGILQLWDLETSATRWRTGEVIGTFTGHTHRITALASLGNGWVVSASSDETLRVWDLADADNVQILKGHTGEITCLAVLGDERIVSGSADQTLRLWDLGTGKSRALKGHTDRITCVAVTRRGHVASASYDGTLRLWDVAREKCLCILEGHTGAITDVTALRDGRAVSVSIDKTLRIWDLDQEGRGQSLACFTFESEPRVVVTCSDDKNLAVGDATGLVHFLRLEETA